MLKKSLLIVAMATISAGAFADSYTGAAELVKSVSTKTRAEVRSELIAAREAGELSYMDADPTFLVSKAKSEKTRAEVKAELAAYLKSGQRDHDARIFGAS